MSSDKVKNFSRTGYLTAEHKLQAQFALAAFATLKAKKIAYISVPITSGKRLYDYMAANGFKTPEEAKTDPDAFFKHVVAPNLAAGVQASNDWAAKMDGAVVAPAEFEKRLRSQNAITWGQDAFMSMWIPMIDEKITDMVMVDGWEYSNGSGEEYMQAALMQMGRGRRGNITVYDDDGRVMTLDRGIGLLVDAFKDVHSRGMRPRNMAETVAMLLEAEHRYNFERSFRRSAEPDNKTAAQDAVPSYDRTKLKAARKELYAIFAQHYPDILPVLEKTSSFNYSPINALFRDIKPPDARPAA
jgi:hypothetical protein